MGGALERSGHVPRISNTDQGLQFTSEAFLDAAWRAGLRSTTKNVRIKRWTMRRGRSGTWIRPRLAPSQPIGIARRERKGL